MDLKKIISSRKGGFWKTLVIILLLIMIGVGAGFFKINSMVGEQLRLTMTPEYLESVVVGTEPKSFEVDILLYNKFVCEASCNYTLTDISRNIVLDRGYFSVKGFKNEHYSKELPMDYNGYGTNLYLYRLECISNHTTLCPANKDTIIRKSMLVLSYEPSVEQLSALSFLNKNYPIISENFVNASKKAVLSKNVLDVVKFSFDAQNYSKLEKGLGDLDEDMAAVLDSWINDDYVSAMSLMDGSDMIERSVLALSEADNYNAYLYKTIATHNKILDDVKQNYYILELYRDILSLSNDISRLNSSESASILNFVLKSNSVITTLNAENYSQDIIYGDMIELGSAIPKLNNIILNNTRQGIIDSYAPLFVYSQILCMLDDESELCGLSNTSDITKYVSSNFSNQTSNNQAANIITSISNVTNGTNTTNTNGTGTIEIDVGYNDIRRVPERFDELCGIASDINSEISESNSFVEKDQFNVPDNQSLDNQSNQSGYNATNSSSYASSEILLLEYKLLSDYEILLGDSKVMSGKTSAYKSALRESLKKNYNITNPEQELIGHQFVASELVLYQDNILISDIDSLARDCVSGSDITLPSLNLITSKYRTIPQFEDPVVKVPKMPVTVSKCCVYNMCQSCATHNTDDPLILLHGHSFNQDVDAYRAIEIFDGFEYALSGESLYFLTGLLVSSGNESAGVLGRYVVPVISKPTYYLETYNDLLGLNVRESKDTTIDTYALRLKDSIDHTLYLTGSDKVDIVAHSMGGLVVRRYMQIFGTQNVDTVILVGTPSNGINSVTYSLCKIFGASAECDDMRSDSLFMDKLNDPLNQPDFTNMYLVVGKGCDTYGIDGDGVVTVDSAVIKNFPEDHILYVDRGDDGCSVTNVFHQDLIRMNKYPKVYEFIKSKLGVS